MAEALDAVASDTLILELLEWVDRRPRSYGEAMEAWRTSCPRMPAWEDAVSAGLIEVAAAGEGGLRASAVGLTALGRDRLSRRD
jgi:hypothetical protein